jgi:PEGA domain-containing protein
MSSLATSDRPEVPLFSDGLGDRVVAADGATADLLQILRLRPALTAVPSFEFALRERTARLANFRHAYYGRVRRVDRSMSSASTLAIVSDHVEGIRLSEILRVAHEKGLQLDINAALCLIRQLVPAVAVLHENARDVANGLISPERLIVNPSARLVIVEHVLGAAIEQLQFGRERLWQEFRVAMPPSAGLPRFDHRADVTGIGIVALSLVLGRPIAADEYPNRIQALLTEARERSALGEEQALSPQLRGWLARALQLDVRRAFGSATEAMGAFEEIFGDDSMYVPAPVALETFLSRYVSSLLDPVPVAVPDSRERAVATYSPLPASAPASAPAPAKAAALTQAPVFAPVPSPFASRDHDVARGPDPGAAFPPRASVPVGAPVPAPAPPRAPLATSVEFGDVVAHEASSEQATMADVAPQVHELAELLGPKGTEEVQQTLASGNMFNPDEPFTVQPEPPKARPVARSRVVTQLAAVAAAVIVLCGGGVLALKLYGAGAVPAMGTLVVESNPPGVEVFVDGVGRGVTPAKLTVAPGSHILELRGRGVPRVIPINVTAGAEVSQYLEFADAPGAGQLAIQSDPPGAKVIVDGTERGAAPLMVSDLAPGDHEVVLRSDTATARHTVTIQAGGSASLVVPMSVAESTGPVSGWVNVKAPFTVEIYEQGKMLGTSDAERMMMAAGKHELEFVNNTLGYTAKRTVLVVPGKVAMLALELPRGVVNLNAAPWAEVWIDGQHVGETPIGNLSVAIGSHEIVFKHPQFGEKRQAVSVTLGAPVRVSVDMK